MVQPTPLVLFVWIWRYNKFIVQGCIEDAVACFPCIGGAYEEIALFNDFEEYYLTESTELQVNNNDAAKETSFRSTSSGNVNVRANSLIVVSAALKASELNSYLHKYKQVYSA